jgi:copper homeostasis protein
MATTLEIACCNFLSCKNAQLGGAHRIELFENLADGGCTPSFGMIKQVTEKIALPVYVMIRPRGGDFCYTEEEFNIMQADIEICQQLNVDGIVFGILTEAGEVDLERCTALQKLWKYKPITFHRAIDRSGDIFTSAKSIADMGFERILTSGGKKNVEEGINELKKLVQEFQQDIIIMPGAGVTAKNAKHILEITGAKEIHATAKTISTSLLGTFNSNFQDKILYSDLDEIKNLVKEIL